MPRGAPDWGEYAQQDLLVKTFDLGELAVRLGANSIFDRSGSVIFTDKFENGIGHWTFDELSYLYFMPSRLRKFQSPYSCRAKFTGQSDIWGSIRTSIPALITKSVGYEAILMWNGNEINVYTGIKLVQAGQIYSFYAKFEPATNKLYLYTPSGDVLISSNQPVDISGLSWTFMKLIINTEEMKYHRLKVNENVYDISTYSPAQSATSACNQIIPIIQVWNTFAGARDLWIGCVIITVNEI